MEKHASYSEYVHHLKDYIILNTRELYNDYLLMYALIPRLPLDRIIKRFIVSKRHDTFRIGELMRFFIEKHDFDTCVEILKNDSISDTIAMVTYVYVQIINYCIKYEFWPFIQYMQKHYRNDDRVYELEVIILNHIQDLFKIDLIFGPNYACDPKTFLTAFIQQMNKDEQYINCLKYQQYVDNQIMFQINRSIMREKRDSPPTSHKECIRDLQLEDIVYCCNLRILQYLIDIDEYEVIMENCTSSYAILMNPYRDVKKFIFDNYFDSSIDNLMQILHHTNAILPIQSLEFLHDIIKENEFDIAAYQKKNVYIMYSFGVIEIYLYQQGDVKMITDTYHIKKYRKYKKQVDFITSYHINQLTQDLPYYDVNLTKIICDYAC